MVARPSHVYHTPSLLMLGEPDCSLAALHWPGWLTMQRSRPPPCQPWKEPVMSERPVGYLALLRRNRRFRRLWYGQIVSQLGDWFDSIALYSVIYQLTGSSQAVGLLLVAQFLPSALISPWAGVVADRLPRKLVMICTDLSRALLVLLFLLVRTPETIWL